MGTLNDPRVAHWARTLVGFATGVRPGDEVAIIGGVASEPLQRAVYREVVDAGGHPLLLPTFSGIRADLLSRGSDEQIAYVSPFDRYAREEADVLINIMSETNTSAMAGVDPARQALAARARAGLSEVFMRRSAARELRWVLTLWPTDAYAQDAEMATADFAEFVMRACKLDQPDPVAAWTDLSTMQARLIDWISDKQEVHVRGPGTDLRVGIGGRVWDNSDGKMNFPDGEIFTGPVEDSAEGHVRFSFPVVTDGREVDDIRLRFAAGKVVDASAAKNEAYLVQMLDTDDGARRLGEFAFGTNYGIDRFIKNLLFDEKIGGTVHMALGAGYPETGSTNVSAIHWDMICDLRQEGEVDVDGEPFLRRGRFVV